MDWTFSYKPINSAANITRTAVPDSSYIRLWGPDAETQSAYDENTRKMAEELAIWLSSGKEDGRPPWLNDMKRVNRFRMEDLDGTVMAALIPRTCPYTMQQKMTARAMLMDRLDKSIVRGDPPEIKFIDEDDD